MAPRVTSGVALPRIFYATPNVYRRVHQSQPLDSILSQLNAVQYLTPSVSKIHFNNILPKTFLHSSFYPFSQPAFWVFSPGIKAAKMIMMYRPQSTA
jgi:hypothetical protein